MFGIWIPGQGWWKPKDRAYAETRRSVAERYARWVGHGARIEPIDTSLVEGEERLLALELQRKEKSLWRILKRLFSKAGR